MDPGNTSWGHLAKDVLRNLALMTSFAFKLLLLFLFANAERTNRWLNGE